MARARTFISGRLESRGVPSFRIVPVLVVLALLGLGVQGSAASTVPRPSWSVGDFWSYRTNTTIATGFNLTGEATYTMKGTQPFNEGGVTIQADRLDLSGAGTASGYVTVGNGSVAVRGQWILTGEELLEPTDLHTVLSLADLSVNGTYAIGVPFDLRVQNTTSFEILSDGWTYPLSTGSQGDLVVAYNFTQDIRSTVTGDDHANGTGVWTLRYGMSDGVSATVPAGNFLTYPITETWPDGSAARSFFAVEVGNSVLTESYGPDGTLAAISVLTSYRYQAMEPATFLGLTGTQWAIVGPAAAVVAAATVLIWRRFHRRRNRRPPTENGPRSNPDLTSGPRGP